MKKALIFLLTAITFSLSSGCSETTVQLPEVTGNVEISILKTGQSDAIIMNTQKHNIVIDCGESDDGDEVVEYLQSKNAGSIDYLFITHFDKDHVGGVPEVLDNFSAKNIMIPDYEGNNSEYEDYLDSIQKHNYSPTIVKEKTSIVLDDVLLEIYPPKQKAYAEGDNDFSLVISINHGQNSFLFTGDAEKDRLYEVLTQTNQQYDFLKVPHHGKYNKLTKQFIQKINPEYTVTTCSDKNPAEDEVVSVLNSVTDKNYYTKDGDVNILSDGKNITVNQTN